MSDKYQKEIEEILKRAEEVMPKDRPSSAGKQRGSALNSLGQLSSSGRGFKLSAGKIMLASLGLLLLALILGAMGMGTMVPLVVAGLILFVIAYALFFVRPGASYEKRWRGRVIEEQPTPWDRVKRWLKG